MVVMIFAKISSMGICLQNDYADVLQKNGYTYTGADGKTYNSGSYSIVHNKDLIGNRSTMWIPPFFLLGKNETTKGACRIFCYPHSSYFAEVPEQYQRDENGNIKMENGKPVETENWEDYTKKWGTPKTGADGKYINHAIPKLVNPNNPNGEKYEENPF